MNIEKFVSLLELGQLYFTRADRLEDDREGTWSKATLDHLDIAAARGDKKDRIDPDTGTRYVSQSEAARIWKENVIPALQSSRRFMLVNCWREGEHESEAMWNHMPRHGERHALAIKSDLKSVVQSFPAKSRLPDMIARVQYIHYESASIPLSVTAQYFHKRIEFQDEREVRAILDMAPTRPDPNYPERSDVVAIDYSQEVCEVGMGFDIDPGALVHEVVVSPFAPNWLAELVERVVKRYGFTFPVRQSNLM